MPSQKLLTRKSVCESCAYEFKCIRYLNPPCKTSLCSSTKECPVRKIYDELEPHYSAIKRLSKKLDKYAQSGNGK